MTTTSAYADGKFYINNTNNIGGNYLRDAIADLYGLDVIRAEDKKIEISKINYTSQDKEVMNVLNAFFSYNFV